jgi:hypothetical protein
MKRVLREHIRQSNKIEGIYSKEADDQYWEAWKNLKSIPKLTAWGICSLQAAITAHQDLPVDARGAFRSRGAYNVSVGGRLCPSHLELDSLMDNWLSKYEYGAEDPIAAHIEYERIHPFLDGNGRSGRAILWLHQLWAKQEPTLFYASEKTWKYYTLFQDVPRFDVESILGKLGIDG